MSATLLYVPRALEADDVAIVRAHAELGAEILEADAGLAEFARAVRAHDERFDGRGYPDGLAGAVIRRSSSCTASAAVSSIPTRSMR